MTIKLAQTPAKLSALFLAAFLGLTGCAQDTGIDPQPVCGNGLLETGEQCDDGANVSGDGCSANCEEEEQDECGDSTLNLGEGCDDGNTISGDGCSSSCSIEEAQQINEYIQGLGELPPVTEETVENSQTLPVADGDYECTSQNLTETRSISEVSILQDGTTTLFPGAILRGDSLAGNGFTETAFARKPMTYSLSIQDGATSPKSATMQNPTLSEFRNTIGGILAAANLTNVPVSATANVLEVRSEKELEFALGASVNSPQFDVKGQFNFASTSLRSHYLVTVDMRFFTADVDAIINPSDVFADSVTAAEVQQKFSDGNPPVYVSSITYGSRFYVAVESAFDSQEVGAALEASFHNGVVAADGQTSLSTKQVLSSSSLAFVTVGATPEQIAAFTAAIDPSGDPIAGIKAFMLNKANFTAANIGEPLSFQLKHLADNQPAAFGFAGTFDVESCIRVSQNIRVILKSIKASNINEEVGQGQGALEAYGFIKVQTLDSGASNGLLFSRAQTAPLSLPEGSPAVGVGGIQNQVILKIKPEEAKDLRLTFDLNDQDTSNDDVLLNQLPQDVLFIDGFHRDVDLSFSTPSGDLAFVVSFEPIL